MNALERKRKESELMNVKAARVGLEFKIMECLDQIERLEKNIEIQKVREAELDKEISEGIK